MRVFNIAALVVSCVSLSACNTLLPHKNTAYWEGETEIYSDCCAEENYQSGYYYNGYHENGWRYCVSKKVDAQGTIP
ncbi:MAG: hypothetical protein JSR17_00555 [Proteobacteria bacterium]|nr:hypothetical protein [Pseudomonadota bacterium]